ncbi:MAG TPA: sigma-54-dependent Fis family transcriptional regulator [Desulfobacteraceae bacterium]|nr:sigma-54-dependent Fis family transcriptional regulator [Desulfobacteraceae bacterium]
MISPGAMKEQIALSFRRSREYGIDPILRNKNQEILSPAELSQRRHRNAELLDILLPQFEEFYNLLSPNDFIIAAVDADGYILHIRGKEELIEDSASRNCVPGYRWTEKDVGTTAISLALKLKIPIQLVDDEHFCRQAHGLTSSTAPIFGKDKKLIGIIAVSGSSAHTHPHTLYMVTTAARAAEQQLRVLRRNKALAANLNFLDRIISYSRTALIIINSEKQIWRVNQKGAEILKNDDLEGRPLSVLKGLDIDLDDVAAHPESWINKEARLKVRNHNISFIHTVQLVVSRGGERLGAVISFNEVRDIYKLADTIAGTRAHFTFDSIVGSSPAFLEAVQLAKGAASSDSTVLLQGETGTGKELFAQAIHNRSSRHQNPFIPINCGAIPANLLESELFGYVDGTFTGAAKGGKPGKFELANTGTILLDEIGDMPHRMQVKLLRVLQTGEVYRIGADKPVNVDTRIIAATHVNLPTAIREGRFRQDLFYRLNVFPIRIPPLKDRGQKDILRLAALFLSENTPSPPHLSPEARDLLVSYHWPGNVRELENCMQRALHLCGGDAIDTTHLGISKTKTDKSSPAGGTLEEVVRETIEATLKQTNNNRALTAKRLGISRATLYRKLDSYKNFAAS